MADADKNIEIVIWTKAELDGAEAAVKAAGKLTEGVKEQAEQVEILGLKHEQFDKAVEKLGETFPLVGKAAKAFANPFIFAITTALNLFDKAKEKLAEWNKELDEAGKIAAEPVFLEAIHARREAMERAALATGSYAGNLRHLIELEAEYQKAIAARIELLNEQYAAQEKIRGAGKSGDLEQINPAERQLHITREQSIVQRAAEEEKYAARDRGTAAGQRQKVIDEKKRDLKHVSEVSGALADAVVEKQPTAAGMMSVAMARPDVAAADLARLVEGYAQQARISKELFAKMLAHMQELSASIEETKRQVDQTAAQHNAGKMYGTN